MGGSRVSRRTLLGAAAASALGIATGCTAGSSGGSVPSSGPASGGSSATPATTSTASTPTGDVGLVLAALTDEQTALQGCRRARLRYPALADQVDPLVAVLTTHIRVLALTLPDGTTWPPPTGSGTAGSVAAARVELTSTVTGLARRRLSDCVAADAGTLATLFASAAAAHQTILASWTGP